MALTSMKTSAEEAKEYSAPVAGDPPAYPYGLCLSIDDDTMAKLGISKVPAVGKKFTVTALAVVTNSSQYATEGKEAEASFSLQITAMELIAGSNAADLYA